MDPVTRPPPRASHCFVSECYSVRPAAAPHLALLNGIELAAAQLLNGHAPRSVLEETTPLSVFEAAMRQQQLWVALVGETPVGFAHVEMLGIGRPHLDELDVHPSHGRKGVGTRLVHAVCDWAAAAGHAQVTLTTFRWVPWNMPWYARLGFVELPPEQWSQELRAQVDSETARGLDPARRVVMTYRCS